MVLKSELKERMENKMEDIKDKGNRPVNQLTIRGCHVAVWEHMNQEGKEYRQCSVSKLYTDTNGEMQNGSSFSISDIPNLMLALDEIYKKEVIKH